MHTHYRALMVTGGLALTATALVFTFAPTHKAAMPSPPHPAAPPLAIPQMPELRQRFTEVQAGAAQSSITQQAIEREQIDEALQLLQSKDPAQRHIGAEQLGAYPSAESEPALLKAARDPDDAVCQAAFASLGQLTHPSPKLITGLLGLVPQGRPLVAESALDTLLAYQTNTGPASPTSRQMTTGLKQLLRRKSLPTTQRQKVIEFLETHP